MKRDVQDDKIAAVHAGFQILILFTILSKDGISLVHHIVLCLTLIAIAFLILGYIFLPLEENTPSKLDKQILTITLSGHASGLLSIILLLASISVLAAIVFVTTAFLSILLLARGLLLLYGKNYYVVVGEYLKRAYSGDKAKNIINEVVGSISGKEEDEMTVVQMVTVGELKKQLDQFDDDMPVDFGDYEFIRLKEKPVNTVSVEMNLITDYIQDMPDQEQS